MSRQFDVFILPSDANSLVEGIRSRFGLQVSRRYSRSLLEQVEITSPVLVDSLWLKSTGATSIECCLTPLGGRIERRYYEKPNHWVVDSYSEMMEFSGCDFDGWTLMVGRFYYETAFVRNLEWVKKGPGFLKWADAVFRYTKKTLRRDKQLDAYVGKDADAFRQAGGVFTRDAARGPVHANSIPVRLAPPRTPLSTTIN